MFSERYTRSYFISELIHLHEEEIEALKQQHEKTVNELKQQHADEIRTLLVSCFL